MAESKLTHRTYQFVDEKDADAVAWVFTDKNLHLQRAPFKFPPLKSDEARAKVTYTGLCHSDIHTAANEWNDDKVHPIAPGHEIVGIVTEVGSDVKDLKVGDRIGFGAQRNCCETCEFCKMTCDQFCKSDIDQIYTYGEYYWGGYASHIQHPAKFFFKIPTDLPENRIPPLFCAGATVYAPIARHAKPGQEVAVLGIGGLGHLAVQYAKAWGCKVTAFTSSQGKEKFIKGLGADNVVVSTEETLKRDEGKYDLIINTLPVVTDLSLYVRMTKPIGYFCQVGLPPVTKPAPFNFDYIVFHQINFVGSLIGSRKEVKEMLEFSSRHNIVPLCEEFNFEDFPNAVDKLLHGKPIFRCVVDVTKFSLKKE